MKKQHRAEVQALQRVHEQAHGANLDLRRELDRRRDAAPPQPAHVIDLAVLDAANPSESAETLSPRDPR